MNCNEWEQYSRHQYLPIEGILKPHKEKVEDVIILVRECFAEADVDIPDTVVDRAHRIGLVYKEESDQSVQGIIVKFNNFRYQCRSSTIVAAPRPQKTVDHDCWPTDKILGFKWAKTTQMSFKRLPFSGTFLNMFRIFLVWQNISFYKGIFYKNPEI